jgi:hypothetical protein
MVYVQKQKNCRVKWFCQEYGHTVTNCYYVDPSPANMRWHHDHYDPIAPHKFICALSQVKDKQDDTISFSSQATQNET